MANWSRPAPGTRVAIMPLSLDTVRWLLDRHGEALLLLAGASIRHTLATGSELPVDPAALPPALMQTAASFVSLHRGGALRGCIGSAQAWRALAVDVAGNAAAAAFEEPRFPTLTAAELSGLTLSVSVLTAPEPIAAPSAAALIDALRPGHDGLILRDGERVGVFLPQVWDAVPDAAEFVARLAEKAGLPAGHWPPTLEARRFATASVESGTLFDDSP